MPSDPRSHARAALLAGAMTFELPPLDPFEILLPAVRRVVPRITPPLDLSVNPFRYRIRDGKAEPVRPHCGHGHRRPRARGRKRNPITR